MDYRKAIQKLFSQSLLALGIKVGNGVLALLMNILIARLLGIEQFGIYAVIFALLTASTFLGTYGMHISIMQFYPRIEKSHGLEAADYFLWQCFCKLLRQWAWSFLILLCGAVGYYIYNLYQFETVFIGVYALPFVVLTAIGLTATEFFCAALRLKDRNISALAPRDIYWRSVVCFLVWLCLQFKWELSLSWLCISMCLILGVMVFKQYKVFLNSLTYTRSTENTPLYDQKEFKKSLIYSWVNMISMSIMFQSSTLIIGQSLGAAEAGIYFAADRLAFIMSLVTIALTLIAIPILSKAFHHHYFATLRKLYVMICVGGLTFSLPLLCLIIFYGDHILLYLYHDPLYADGHIVLIILSSAWFISTIIGPITTLSQAVGLEKNVFFVSSTTAFVVLILMTVLVQRYGAVGGAASVAIALVGQKLSLLLINGRKIFWSFENKA
ncbi:MAG: oligosaccharide flippase family protein [Pseudomonadota bacterium]